MFTASFDGHGNEGGTVASRVAAHFSKKAMDKVSETMISGSRLRGVFFKELDKSLNSDCAKALEHAGSTMSLLQITPEGKLYTYTLGDSRTMIFQNGKCQFSTIDMSAWDCIKAEQIVLSMTGKSGDELKLIHEIEKDSKFKNMILKDLRSGSIRHKYFTNKYGQLSPAELQDVYISHLYKRAELKKAGKDIDDNNNRVDSCLAVCSAWGDNSIFKSVKHRFLPLLQSFDLKELDADAPLQILIGSDGIMDPFNADQLANYIKESEERNLQCRLVKLVSDTKEGTGSTQKSTDNISLTLMELKLSMLDK